MAFAALAIVSAPGNSQVESTHVVGADSFAPLEQWKNAVTTRDSSALHALYAANASIAVAKETLSASEEIDFLLALKASSIKLNVLKNETPQPERRVIVFQAEIESKAGSQKTVYLSEAQAWAQHSGQWSLAGVQRTGITYLQQPVSQDKDLYPAEANARAEIKEAEQKAAADHKRVLVVFGANWCYDCHVLDLAFHRSDFAATLSGYEVVHVDIGDDGKKNNDIAKECSVPLDKGIPAVAVLDSSGKLLVSQKDGEFENARAMTPQVLLEFLNRWKPQAQ